MKKVWALLICICLFASVCVQASEMEGAFLEAEICGDVVLVSGRFPTNQNQPVAIKIMLGNIPAQLTQVKTERFGYFSAEFSEAAFSANNTYDIKATCLGMDAETVLCYYGSAEEQNILGRINSAETASDLKEIIDSSVNMLNKKQYNSLSDETKLSVCDTLTGIDYTTIADFKTSFYDEVNAECVKIADSVEFYVSPHGNDNADGLTANTAFATIKRAKDAIRKSLYAGNECHHTVYLMDGVYYLDDTLVFTEYDSGTEDYKITYKNYMNDKPVLSGSREISGWNEYGTNGIFVANIGSGLDVKVLYEDGIMQTLARYPNQNKTDFYEGYLEAVKNESSPYTTFYFDAKDGIPETASSDLEAYIWADDTGYNKWHSKTISAQIDYGERQISLDSETYYPIGTGSTYFLQGALEFLDAEGEFYYNKDTGELFYKPTDGIITDKVISIPTTDDIIRFEGTTDKTYAHDIVLDGLTIQNSARTDNLDSSTFYGNFNGNGITIKDSKRITVQNCIINNIGGNGIYLLGGASNNQICKNEIYNTAVHGVQFAGEEKSLICRDNYIKSNLIHDTGLLAGIGSGISVMHTGSGYNYITHNKIYRTMRYGIRVSSNNKPCLYPTYVEYNDVSEANMCANDTGVIEVTYQQGGTIIKNNHIHGTQYAEGKSMLIYIDEMNSNVTVEKNVISDIVPGEHAEGFVPVMIKGANNIIINNYIVNVPDVYKGVFVFSHQFTDAEDTTISRNIVYNCGNIMYRFTNNDLVNIGVKTADNNMYYDNGGELYYYVSNAMKSFSEWKAVGQDTSTLTNVNPSFMNVAKKDYRLKYNSEARNLSVDSINMKDIGLEADYPICKATGEIDRLFINGNDTSFVNLDRGESVSLELYGRTTNGYLIEVAPEDIAYINYNSDIADVNNEGVVVAKNSGVAEIIANVNGKSISCHAVVNDGNYGSVYVHNIEYADINGNSQESDAFTEPCYAHIYTTSYLPSDSNTKAIMGAYKDGALVYADVSDSVKISPLSDNKFLVESLGDDVEYNQIKLFFWNDNLVPVGESKLIENKSAQ